MIYLASSWRNELQPAVVHMLREWGHDVYDFRNPEPGDKGFHWSAIDPLWQEWTCEQYRRGLHHPVALDGFAKDMDALRKCDACVLLLPCGRSAHAEAGWCAGAGKPVFVFMPVGKIEPELMYLMFNEITNSIPELRYLLSTWEPASNEEKQRAIPAGKHPDVKGQSFLWSEPA